MATLQNKGVGGPGGTRTTAQFCGFHKPGGREILRIVPHPVANRIGLCSYLAMAHNPPRVWFTESDLHKTIEAIERKKAEWHTLDELADRMMARAAQGKKVVLSPGTAEYLAKWIKQSL